MFLPFGNCLDSEKNLLIKGFVFPYSIVLLLTFLQKLFQKDHDESKAI